MGLGGGYSFLSLLLHSSPIAKSTTAEAHPQGCDGSGKNKSNNDILKIVPEEGGGSIDGEQAAASIDLLLVLAQ